MLPGFSSLLWQATLGDERRAGHGGDEGAQRLTSLPRGAKLLKRSEMLLKVRKTQHEAHVFDSATWQA